MRVLLGLLLGASAFAQSTPTEPAQAAATFYGGGITGFPKSSPKPNGFFVVATELSKSAKIFSFSETDAILLNKKIQTSARTGLATPLRTFGSVTLYALGDAGVASTGTNTGGAYAAGAIATIPIKGKFIVFPGLRYVHSATGGSRLMIGVGIGRQEKP